jgi:CRP-like cAMP-binding protein
MTVSLQDASWLIRSLRPERSHPVGDAALGALAFWIERRRVTRGDTLYRSGSVPRGVWVIRTGCVQLSFRVAGARSVVQILRPGDVAGDETAVLGSTSLATARVRQSGTFLFLPADRLRSILAAHADLCYLWMQNVALRLKEARRRILELLGDDLAQSVARLILDEEVDGRVSLAQSDVAEMLGVQRTSVNRVLGVLQQRGVVEVHYGSVAIKDREALEHVAMLTRRLTPDGEALPA